MAELVVVAVKDRAMDAFVRPFFVLHRAMAVRAFSDEMNRPDSDMFKHPDDYDLYLLCLWDEGNGRFVSFDDTKEPELLVRGKDVFRKSNGS